ARRRRPTAFRGAPARGRPRPRDARRRRAGRRAAARRCARARGGDRRRAAAPGVGPRLVRLTGLAVAALALGCATPSADVDIGDYATNLSYTQETQWSIFTIEGRRPLRTILPHLALPYVFGVYSMAFDLNGDNRLYLFPSLEYAVTAGCD